MNAGFSRRETLANSHDLQRVDDVHRFPIEIKVLDATFETFRHLQSQQDIQQTET